MFCGYCGKQMADDMLFCPYCGKKIGGMAETESANEDINIKNDDINKVVADVQVVPEARIMPSVAEDAKKYANRNSDDWYFYNHLQNDATDLPDIEGDYLVSGLKKLLLSDISKYEWRKVEKKEMISIYDKNGACIDMELKGTTAAAGVAAAGAIGGGLLGVTMLATGMVAGNAQEKENSRIVTQLMRIAPLCGDDLMKKQGRMVCELMCAASVKRYYPANFFLMFDKVKKMTNGEYPIFEGALSTNVGPVGDLLITNKRLNFSGANTRSEYEFEDIISLERKGNDTIVFNLKDGKKRKQPLHSKDKADAVDRIWNYYKQGRIDEFIENEYKPDSGIVQHKVL